VLLLRYYAKSKNPSPYLLQLIHDRENLVINFYYILDTISQILFTFLIKCFLSQKVFYFYF